MAVKEASLHTVRFMCRLADSLRPKEMMTVSEWAEKYMVLPRGSSISGKYSSRYAPYQKAIMDAITDPEVVNVTVMSSAQIGKTLIILCGIGYYIAYEPAEQMLVLPTIDMGQKFSKTRIANMIADVLELSARVAPPKAKDSNNTILMKSYPGGSIIIGGANSAASLSSHPRRIVWMDETDRFPESAGSEGNPIELAETRTTSYWNRKHIKTSTPTIAGRSKIEEAYSEGTQEEWCVRCPECGQYQPYNFLRMDFESLSMACEECGCMVPERAWKESEHKWIAVHPERKDNRSFHLNQMASPFVEWKEIVRKFNKAMRRYKKYHDPEDLKVFVNTVLGEPWDETEYVENAVSEETVQSRAEYYEAELPDGVLLLTAAVDVQDNRFEVEVRGWAREYETWGIQKTEIYGNLITDEPWEELEEYLERTFRFSDGRELGIAAYAIDSGGHFTNSVYKWQKKMKKMGKRCYAVKGYAGKPDIPLLYKRTLVDITEEYRGKKVVVDRTVLHIIGVDSGKDDITNRLAIAEPGAGYCHFPLNEGRGYTKEYYEGLTSEHKITKKVNGRLKDAWVKKDGVRNEPFDLLNYNYAAHEILRPDFDKLEYKLSRGINYMQPKSGGMDKAAGRGRTRRKSLGGLEV